MIGLRERLERSGVVGPIRVMEEAGPLAHLPCWSAALRPGEASVHHPRVVHRSGANRSTRPRLAVALRLLTPRVPPRVSGCGEAFPLVGRRAGPYRLRPGFPLRWNG